MVYKGVLGVAGGKQYLERRTPLRQFFGKLPAVYLEKLKEARESPARVL